ncbi:protein OSB2, chloroplastic-like isoform X2 [Phalaenopsis equestris]|uniref:protein OSB2, chloroplastic-like isoform X2 n=1 Tax=Phalaenopsis equestris TaxID=78828 RepID=UPI0009E54B04|nr:protein OSB2, chloroplastic-like isoform X2 [Phalaenopsis equestris]
MALPALSQFKSPLPRLSSPSPSSSLKPPNIISSSLHFSSRHRRRTIAVALPQPSFISSSFNGDHHHDRIPHARPPEIPWSKDMANSVNLIGTIGASVQIKQLSSGKVLAWTRLGFKKSSSETSWINLTFWDELAHVAFQHVEKGNQVHVSGRLVSDTTEGEDDRPLIFYKIVVQQLNFIERSFQPAPSYEQGLRNENYSGNNFASSSAEELWQAFFANPVDWWDNRKNKKNSRYPDFKHKHTGEALWIEGKNNPPWVKGQLAILDEKMSSFQPYGSNSTVSLLNGNNDFLSL